MHTFYRSKTNWYLPRCVFWIYFLYLKEKRKKNSNNYPMRTQKFDLQRSNEVMCNWTRLPAKPAHIDIALIRKAAANYDDRYRNCYMSQNPRALFFCILQFIKLQRIIQAINARGPCTHIDWVKRNLIYHPECIPQRTGGMCMCGVRYASIHFVWVWVCMYPICGETKKVLKL